MSALPPSDPAVAWNATDNEYLVVWEGDDNTAPLVDEEFEIFGQRVNAATAPRLAPMTSASPTWAPDGNISFAAFNPAVAYNATTNEYLVVWEGDDDTAPLVDEEFEIFGQRIDCGDGTEIGTNDFRISDMGPDGDVSYDAFSTGRGLELDGQRVPGGVVRR